MKKYSRHIDLESVFIWKIASDIPYDSEKESFYDYLRKEKDIYDRRRPFKKVLPIIGAIVLLLISSFYSTLMCINFMITFFVDGIFIGPPQFQSEIFSLLVITSIFASILGQLLVIFLLTFKYFFTKSKWSKFHDQTLLLAERLVNSGLLKEYIQFTENSEDQNGFRLIKISVDFQIEWIFPFIFQDFPPLLFEIILLSFLFPFSIATLVSLFVAFTTADWFTVILMFLLFALIIMGSLSNSTTIFKSWSNYSRIRTAMINKQYGVIHSMILQGENDLSIIRNENNLARLEKMHSFPLPSVFRITTFIPLIGSLLGYIVGLAILL